MKKIEKFGFEWPPGFRSRYAKLSRFDVLVSLVNWGCIPLFASYLICMVLAPAYIGGWSWHYVQSVWDRWQTLNAGILAFIASVIAFNISKYQENKQRERSFVAAKAFLPNALSELIGYFEKSANLLTESWVRLDPHPLGPISLAATVPALPDSYKATFSGCIEQAEPTVGEYLAKILVKLQVHHSRLSGLHLNLTTSNRGVETRENVLYYLFGLGELYGLVGKLFPFARGEPVLDDSPLIWGDYDNAFANLEVYLSEIHDLEAKTKLWITLSSESEES